jgi:hypothetical protein
VRYGILTELQAAGLPVELVLLYSPLRTLATHALARPASDPRPFLNILEQFKAMYRGGATEGAEHALERVTEADIVTFLMADTRSKYVQTKAEKEAKAAYKKLGLGKDGSYIQPLMEPRLVLNTGSIDISEAVTTLRGFVLPATSK